MLNIQEAGQNEEIMSSMNDSLFNITDEKYTIMYMVKYTTNMSQIVS